MAVKAQLEMNTNWDESDDDDNESDGASFGEIERQLKADLSLLNHMNRLRAEIDEHERESDDNDEWDFDSKIDSGAELV
jgi:hypothetical protein